jgi:CBS domain-containing protein
MAQPGRITSTVADILRDDVALLHPDHGLDEAAVRFAESGLPLLPVVDGDEVVGVVMPADILRGDPAARDDLPTTVAHRMSTLIPICGAGETLEAAREAMVADRTPAVLVVDNAGALVGIVTRDDLDDGAPRSRRCGTCRDGREDAHHVRSAGRATPEPMGTLKSYSVVPRIRQRVRSNQP